MRKKLFIAGLAILCIVTLIGGSVAFRSVTGTAESTVTASNLSIELVMLEEDESGAQKTVSGDIEILPGQELSRIAIVKNIGSEPAWVRISTDPMAENENFSILDVGTDWTYQDGYWYYNKALEPGQASQALFTGIIFSESINSEMSGEQLALKVNAEGTQTAHNGNSALEAQGWPE